MIVDLYAGAGGVSTGLQLVQQRHGLDERVVGVELDPLACMTATAAGHERIRAVGRLQSFPGGYPWQGDRSRACLQAANAVPPLMYAGIVDQLVRPL